MSASIMLISQDWEAAFRRLFREATEELVLIAPFIGSEPVEILCEELSQRGLTTRLTIRCITNFSPAHLLSGSVDSNALLKLTTFCPRSQVFHLGGLHAKVYIVDRQAALITSTNFTLGGWRRNWELGLRLEDSSLVEEAYHWAQALWRISTPLTREDLVQLDQLSAGATGRPPASDEDEMIKESIQKVLVRARLHSLLKKEKAESPQGSQRWSENRIFAATILYLLKEKGPLTTQELHPLVQALHPELCDDTVDRIIDGKSFGKRWKHMVRNAQQYLKRLGKITYDSHTRRWVLVKGPEH